jgi:hypothetical protein
MLYSSVFGPRTRTILIVFEKLTLREGGGQNTRGPECSEGPGNLGKMFVLFIIALCVSYMKYAYLHTDRRVIDRKTYRPNVKYTIFRSFSQQKQLADCDEK